MSCCGKKPRSVITTAAQPKSFVLPQQVYEGHIEYVLIVFREATSINGVTYRSGSSIRVTQAQHDSLIKQGANIWILT